jgi:4-amino-4-deoxy-L-arabinose transferase-like glycosyltransferase
LNQGGDATGEFETRREVWLGLGLILALSLPILLLGLGNHGFWLTDEPFVAEVAREMAQTGDLVIPRLNGEPFLEKPPLYYATVALSYRLLGFGPLAARIPSALFSMGTLILTYLLGLRLLSRCEARYGALILATLSLFVYAGHYCLVDSGLAFFVALATLAASHGLGEDAKGWALPLLYGSAGMAFLCKGLVGPVLVLAGTGAAAASLGDWRFFRRRAHVPGAVLLLAVIALWAAGLHRVGGTEYLREAFLQNNVGRFFKMASLVPGHDGPRTHAQPFYSYFLSLPWSFFPWTPVLLLAALRQWPRQRGRVEGPRGEVSGARPVSWASVFLWVFFSSALVILSLARTKRGMYILPLLPVLSLLAAREMARIERLGSRLDPLGRAFVWFQAAAMGLFTLGVPGVYLYLVLHFDVPMPSWRAYGVPGALLLASAAGLLLTLQSVRRLECRRFFSVQWAQAAGGFLSLAVLCMPLMEQQKCFDPFFREAARIERGRAGPLFLFLANETYIGYAGLHLQRTLPPFNSEEGLALFRKAGCAADLITDRHGLQYLATLPGGETTMLAQATLWGLKRERSLYMVHFTKKGRAER